MYRDFYQMAREGMKLIEVMDKELLNTELEDLLRIRNLLLAALDEGGVRLPATNIQYVLDIFAFILTGTYCLGIRATNILPKLNLTLEE